MTSLTSKILNRAQIAAWCEQKRAQNQAVVFTNGCFDVLHAGHIELLHEARAQGDCLVVGLNSDASVKRLKGDSRPIHDQDARALVMSALQDVDAVCVFEEDTPLELIAQVKPRVHVKGGDYRPEDLPESPEVRRHGGRVVIVPLRQGFSSTAALEKMNAPASVAIVIPARYGSTRFPGKPLAKLGGQTVIERVARAALQTGENVFVATDDERIAQAVAHIEGVRVAMTSQDCHTGTDRIAQVAREHLTDAGRQIIVNVQGDEPFVDPHHIQVLIEAMTQDAALEMATLATPLESARFDDPNVVKVVCGGQSNALYFSRAPIPFARESNGVQPLRHLGLYAYSRDWLLKMAALPPSPLEETEKLEQLRALEHGIKIKVLTVQDVVEIAIDTPQDLERAQQYLAEQI